MTENDDNTLFELEIYDVQIAVAGSEAYVNGIINRIGEIIATVRDTIKRHPVSVDERYNT